MGKNQSQHYLPRVYLAGFSTPAGNVWRYDRAHRALKVLAPAVVGTENNLYALVTDEEVSHEIETHWFSPLDGRFGPILRDIEKGKCLSSDDCLHLANFVAYLRVRTPVKIRELEATFQQYESFLGPDLDSITYHAGPPPDTDADTYVMSKERCELVSDRRGADSLRNEALKTCQGR
jgi:Protein of unknown function (DUF4238)